MRTFHYKKHFVMLERQIHNGSTIATAVPDTGETIRRVFYGYTQAEVRQAIKNEIKGATK